MHFAPPQHEVIPPLALQELDSRLGTQTQDAYRVAIETAPHLGSLVVALDDQNSYIQLSELGIPSSYVSLNPNPGHYYDGIRSGVFTVRLGEYSDLYRSKGITPSVNELVVAFLLHEIGHANDFADYISRASGDTQAAFKLSNQVRRRELATLPLKMATSHALRAWDANTNGYRDMMQSHGVTDEIWEELIEENLCEYGKLPSEQVADRFALGVLATVNA